MTKTTGAVAWGAIGLAIGAVIGIAFSHQYLGVWMVIGAGIGLLIQGLQASGRGHTDQPRN